MNSIRLLILVIFLSLVAVCPPVSAYDLSHHLSQGSRDMFTRANVPVVLGGSSAAFGALAFGDRPAEDFLADHHRLGRLESFGNEVLGTGAVGGLIGVGTLFYGLHAKHALSVDSGEAHLEALFMTFVYTSLLKVSVQRERPDESNRASFPSGHTSTMACSSAVLMSFYGPMVGVPMLLLTAVTGAARIADDKHHLSDVLAGATLGYWVGASYSQHHRSEKVAQWSLEPLLTSESVSGISMRYVY